MALPNGKWLCIFAKKSAKIKARTENTEREKKEKKERKKETSTERNWQWVGNRLCRAGRELSHYALQCHSVRFLAQRVMFWIGCGYAIAAAVCASTSEWMNERASEWVYVFVAILFLICSSTLCAVLCNALDIWISLKWEKQKYSDTNVIAKREMNTNVFYSLFFGAFLRFSFIILSKLREKKTKLKFVSFVVVVVVVVGSHCVRTRWWFWCRARVGFAPAMTLQCNIRILVINNQLFYVVFFSSASSSFDSHFHGKASAAETETHSYTHTHTHKQ